MESYRFTSRQKNSARNTFDGTNDNVVPPDYFVTKFRKNINNPRCLLLVLIFKTIFFDNLT